MLEILHTILMFIIAISVLVAIHEFGHFWVAKKLGVKVLRYSIGFGKPIWCKRGGPDNTEYVIAALPLGGYVKMLDEREGEVAEEELHRAFNRQPVSKRFAIVLAGPAFNFIFAIAAYWLVYVIGVSGITPIIGKVIADSPAAVAGLKADMEVLEVNGKATPIWEEVFRASLPTIVDKGVLEIKARSSGDIVQTYQLDLSKTNIDQDIKAPFRALGIQLFDHPVAAVIDSFSENSPALKAGLQVGDRIVRIDQHEVNDWRDISTYVFSRPNTEMTVYVRRDGKLLDYRLRTASDRRDGELIGIIGVQKNDEAFKIDVPPERKTIYRADVFYASYLAVDETVKLSSLTLKLLWKMVTGEVSVRNISGPVNIAYVAGQSANLGFMRFLTFMALVSISLGVLNLLPIPILDGGHLFFYIIEYLRGRPVSEEVEMFGQKLGLAMLLMLMTLAFYNDILRFL